MILHIYGEDLLSKVKSLEKAWNRYITRQDIKDIIKEVGSKCFS